MIHSAEARSHVAHVSVTDLVAPAVTSETVRVKLPPVEYATDALITSPGVTLNSLTVGSGYISIHA